MMPHMRYQTLMLLASLVFMAVGCSSSNRLKDYSFDNQRAAVIAAIPPAPFFFADSGLDGPPPRGLFDAAVRVSGAIAHHKESRRAQARFDSALTQIDVAEAIAGETLLRSARYLGYDPIDDPRAADVVLDLRVEDYGLVADSWEATVHFELNAEIRLVDNETKAWIWKKKIREVEPISQAMPLGPGFGSVYTARALSRLSVEEMVEALENLASYTAHRLTMDLREAYYESRPEVADVP